MEDCSIKQEQNERKMYLLFLRRDVREGRLRVIREETEYNYVKGIKEESGGK